MDERIGGQWVKNRTNTGAWIARRYREPKKYCVWMLLGDKGKYTEEQAKAEAALIRGLKMVEGQQSVQYTAESHSGRTPRR